MNQEVKLKDPGTCRIFFSSPFGGMEEEREELTKKYFPQLHHACNAKGIKFVPVDMRWGITKEAADNAQVMSICLREVDRSDFFVGFFGQRYGWHSEHLSDSMLVQNFDNATSTHPWVNKFRDRSMTEIEVRRGHLNSPGAMPACFCFRAKEYDDLMRDEGLRMNKSSQVKKYEVENEFAENMRNDLIQEVVDTQDKTWGVHLNCKNPQEMAKNMFDSVWKFLTEVLLKDFTEEEIPFLTQQRLAHDQFVSSTSRVFCGCENYMEQLMDKVHGPPNKGLVVTGPAGCGKSALLANWMLSLQKNNPHIILIHHFIGCAPGTERPRNILERILLELQNSFPHLCAKSPAPDKDGTKVTDDSENENKNTSNVDNEPVNMKDQLTVDPGESKDIVSKTEEEKDENSNKKTMDNDKAENLQSKMDENEVNKYANLLPGNSTVAENDEKIATNLVTIMPMIEEIKTEEETRADQNVIPGKDFSDDQSPQTDKDVEKKEDVKDPNISDDASLQKDKEPNDKGKEENKKEEGKEAKSGLEKKSTHQIMSEIVMSMNSISDQGHKVVIILDALNQQKSMEKNIKHLYWLPESFPDGVTFVCSTLDSDTATHDLLVTQRKMDKLVVDPFDSELQKSICIKTLKVAGKELSPHQLDRVINAKETSNVLFLKLVLYELSIYGSFNKLDEKIDSLINVNGVKLLLQVILDRLETDYNSEDYDGNIVKDVLCCLIASRKGLSENEMTEILKIPTHLWSPLFFALEHLLSQYTGLLGFAFLEMKEAVSERYLTDPSHIIPYKKKLIDYYNGIRKTMKPWNKNRKPEVTRVIEELPWLQLDVKDKRGLIDTLSDLCILNKLAENNTNHLLFLWQQTGLPWSAVSSMYMKSFDKSVVDLHEEKQNGVIESTDSPGMKIRVSLQYMRSFFDTAYYARGSQVAMEREIRILETCESSLSAEKRSEYLRDARYYLAVSYSDQQNEKALALYLAVHEECERLLKEKENSAVKEMLAFTCNGMGLVYYHSKDYIKATEYLERSKKLHREMKNKLHEAASTTNIGLAYLSEKKHNKALTTFDEALQMYEEHFFGKISIEIGNLFTNIALTYRRMKNLDKAEEYYHKSLEMKAMNVGWNHPVIATAYMNLGTLEVHRKRYKESEEYTRKAIAIYEINEFPVTDRQHRMCRENLCVNMLKQGKKHQVLPLYIEITNILVDNGWMDEIIVSLHREMLEYMLDLDMFKEVEKFSLALLASSKRRAKFAYILADMDSRQPVTTRAFRPKELTIESFMEEYPKENMFKVLYVTDVLSRNNRLEEIIQMCHDLHEKEADLKEGAYSFAAESLVNFGFLESGKKIAQLGLEKYPDHLELMAELLKCLVELKKTEELSTCVPVLLAAPDWENIKGSQLMDVAKLLEDSHPLLSYQCYEKISVSPEGVLHLVPQAREGMKKLFPNGPPSVSDSKQNVGDGKEAYTNQNIKEEESMHHNSEIVTKTEVPETKQILTKDENGQVKYEEKDSTAQIPVNLTDVIDTSSSRGMFEKSIPTDNENANSTAASTEQLSGDLQKCVPSLEPHQNMNLEHQSINQELQINFPQQQHQSMNLAHQSMNISHAPDSNNKK